MLKKSAHDILRLCCLHNETKGQEHEQIQEVITHDLALRVSYRADPAEAVDLGTLASHKGKNPGPILRFSEGTEDAAAERV